MLTKSSLTKRTLTQSFTCLSTVLLAAVSQPSMAELGETLPVSKTQSGEVGMIEMPTARMMQEGQFGLQFSHAYPYTRMVLSAQPLPWFEVLFKYTDIATALYGEEIAGSQTLKDKGMDFKVRLLQESYYLPEVSAGIRDIGGTGLFSSEYVVASKQYKNWDFSLGLGWGQLGQQDNVPNPLSFVSTHFDTRYNTETGQGGTVDVKSFFTGKTALFGGLSYHFKQVPISLQLEYDGNNYRNEAKSPDIEQDIPINVGAVYRYSDGISLSAGVVRGNTAFFSMDFHTNFNDNGNKKVFDPKPVAINGTQKILESNQDTVENVNWNALQKQIKKQGFEAQQIIQKDNQITLKGESKLFHATAKSYGRAARILTNTLPETIQSFEFVEQNQGLNVVATKIDRDAFTNRALLLDNTAPVLDSITITPTGSKEALDKQQSSHYESDYPRVGYSVSPSFSGSLGGPDGFLLYQLGVTGTAKLNLSPSFWLDGGLTLGLLDNYDNFDYQAPSNLPRVRTYIRDYLKTSRLRMKNLQATKTANLGTDWFAATYGGYLESMYGGVGGEVLYRPFGEAWALGLDANYVKQRAFDQGFGFRDYETYTGHLTGYYERDDNVLIKLSAGRYLAKDVGMTFDISRRFKNNAQIGFWATKTNVSAEEFGEGSFDKGFYITLPFSLYTLKSTKQTGQIRYSFLTRDGGQKLNRQTELYDLTDLRRVKALEESFEKVLE